MLAVVVAAAGSVAPSHALPGRTSVASVTSGEAQANGPTPATSVPDTTSPALSLDGLSVAFSSDASNLVSGDTNRVSDVFLRNLVKGTTKRVSLTASGAQPNGASYSPAMNVYGTKLAFVSEASNIVSGDTNGVADVFLRDLVTGSVKRISVSSSGAQANGPSNSPFVSLFGEWITFQSAATNLSSGDTNGLADAFLRDTKTSKTSRLTAPPLSQESPATAATQWTEQAQISYDGHFVSYVRVGTRNIPWNLPVDEAAGGLPGIPAQPNDLAPDAPDVPSAPVTTHALDVEAVRTHHVPSALDIYILDRQTHDVSRLPVPAQNLRIMNDHPALSADGRVIAFEQWRVLDKDDAIVRDPTDYKKIVTYDRVVKAFGLASVPTFGGGIIPPDGDSTDPSISAGGSIVSFISAATNLVTADTNGLPDVFVRDAPARTTSRASVSSTGAQSNASSARPSISYEGRQVVYASGATTLASADGNGQPDVFWRDRQTNTINRAPKMKAMPGVRQLDVGATYTLQVRATDADGDPMRFGILLHRAPTNSPIASQAPRGSSIDPATGMFSWTPTPDQAGPWLVLFWVTDARGDGSYDFVKVNVRNAAETAACALQDTDQTAYETYLTAGGPCIRSTYRG
jgi:hypothetical protein